MRTSILTAALLTLPALATAAPSVWLIDDGQKVRRDAVDTPWERGADNPVWSPGEPLRLIALRDEVVAFQVVVEADGSPLENVTVDFAGLTGPDGARIENAPGADDPTRSVGRRIERFVAHFVDIRRPSASPWGGSLGWWPGSGPDEDAFVGPVPDALIPVEVAPSWAPYPLSIAARQNGIVWIDVYVPRGQAPGTYTGEIIVHAGARELATVPVRLDVGAATLPARPVETALFFAPWYLGQRMGNGAQAAAQQHLWRLYHRHRLVPMHHALNVGDARAALPPLTGAAYTAQAGYEGPGEGLGDGLLSLGTYGGFGPPDANDLRVVEQVADLLAQNDALDDTDVFVYAIDEACGHAWGGQWRRLMDGSNNPNAARVKVGWTCSENVAAQPVDLVMVLASHYSPAEVQAAEAAGKQVWIYNGVQPWTGSLFTDVEAIGPRVNGWIQARRGIDRWFFWHTNFWYDENNGGQGPFDPFTQPESFHNHLNEYAQGDGMLVYPGRQTSAFVTRDLGFDGVVASVRLKNWRRGVQDAGYLQLARAQDAAAANAIADALLGRTLDSARGGQPPDWGTSGQRFFAARADLFALLGGEAPPPPPPPPPPVRPRLEVPRPDGVVSVDGDLREFEGAPAVEAVAGGARATFRLMWDAENLYLGAFVLDPDLVVRGRGRDGELWDADGVELLLDPNADRTPSPTAADRHVVVTAAGDLLDAHGAGGDEDRSADLQVRHAVVRRGSLDDGPGDMGYTVEVAIPWASIGGGAPAAGRVLGGDLALNDATDGDLRVGDWVGLARFAQPSEWGDLALVEWSVDAPPPPPLDAGTPPLPADAGVLAGDAGVVPTRDGGEPPGDGGAPGDGGDEGDAARRGEDDGAIDVAGRGSLGAEGGKVVRATSNDGGCRAAPGHPAAPGLLLLVLLGLKRRRR